MLDLMLNTFFECVWQALLIIFHKFLLLFEKTLRQVGLEVCSNQSYNGTIPHFCLYPKLSKENNKD